MTRQRVLVTGAGGFIGSRVVEVLHLSGEMDVRAGVRRWSTAASVGRTTAEIVQCDVLVRESIEDALRDVTHIVHCAVGDRQTTERGTANLLEAAQKCGVRHVVHLSTIDVYGRRPGVCTEDLALAPTGRAYGDSKLVAEQLCVSASQKGLPVTVLRPTIVYGPMSRDWTIEFAEKMIAGAWSISAADAEGICNLVYVDDVVLAVLCALRAPEPRSEVFNVSGPEAITWADYFRRLNAALGCSDLAAPSRTGSRFHASLMAPVKATAKWAMRTMPGLINTVYQRSSLAKKAMRAAERRIRQAPSAAEFQLYSMSATYPIGRAESALGYVPQFSVDEGVALSAAWLRHSGYLDQDAR